MGNSLKTVVRRKDCPLEKHETILIRHCAG